MQARREVLRERKRQGGREVRPGGRQGMREVRGEGGWQVGREEQ